MTLDELFEHPAFLIRVKRRLPPSYWPMVASVLRAVADVNKHPLDRPDPLAKDTP